MKEIRVRFIISISKRIRRDNTDFRSVFRSYFNSSSGPVFASSDFMIKNYVLWGTAYTFSDRYSPSSDLGDAQLRLSEIILKKVGIGFLMYSVFHTVV